MVQSRAIRLQARSSDDALAKDEVTSLSPAPTKAPIRAIVGSLLVLLASTVIFAVMIIGDFDRPLVGPTDTNQWEYFGYYVGYNLHFSPWPQLNLSNNQVFYPYGISSVFQSFAFERDLFFAALFFNFGPGPWLQIYLLLSVLITACGTYVILLGDHGNKRALAVAFLATFCNFYSMNRFPGHFCFAVVHWAVLSLVTDYLILDRLWHRRKVTLRLMLLRVCLLFLTLGLDLPYIATCSLVATTVMGLAAGVLLVARLCAADRPRLGLIGQLVRGHRGAFRQRWKTCTAMVLLAAVMAMLYIPLAGQLVLESRRIAQPMDADTVTSMRTEVQKSASPARLLVPYLPGFNPATVKRTLSSYDWGRRLFSDGPSGLGGGSVGWVFLIPALIGLWQGRGKWGVHLPLLIILVIFVGFGPELRTLKVFPWAMYTRIVGRTTALYAIIFALLALGIRPQAMSSLRWLALGLLLCLGTMELATAVSIGHKKRQLAQLAPSFFAYMEFVKNQPGEAVLDWPFCIAGGNGVGTQLLGPYFKHNNTVYAYRRFHHKKVMGQYFGRLLPSQIMPYYLAGWSHLFHPDAPSYKKAKRQKDSFAPVEWEFFTEFFKLNDFAGINLYLDLLAEGDEQAFYQRFGPPTIQTVVPGAGRVAFIPKPPDWQQQVNPAAGRALVLMERRFLRESSHAMIALGKYSEAHERLTLWGKLQPGEPTVHYLQGVTLTKLGRYEPAIAHLSEALRLNHPKPMLVQQQLDQARSLQALCRDH